MTPQPPPVLPAGQVVVVTGAARGIGAATARLLAAHGARLALCDRLASPLADVASSLVDGGVDVLSTVVDVRAADAVDAFVAAVGDRFGRVDGLVNNAGGTFVAPALDVSAKGEAMLVAENFTQVLHMARRCVPLMGPGASIVNVTSVEAHQAAPGFAVYAAMKAAVANLTRSLALELAPQGVRVNAMAPDALVSDGEDGARDAMLATDMAYRPAMVPPLGHRGTPEDGAATIAFLLGPMSRFVTGTTVHVDGGTWAAGGWQRLGPEG
jgi:NAD(P)-dependent dehydrogenase (short-subunit alcohol dehydrogenase family)